MKKSFFLLILPLLLAGCGLQLKNEPVANGGMWTSIDQAVTWALTSRIATISDTPDSLSTSNVNFIKLDPVVNSTLYASTRERGLFVSWDGGKSWRQVLGDKGEIIDLAIDNKNSCILYAATAKNVYLSTDCGRRWESTFSEKRSDAQIRAITIDVYETNNIILGLQVGGNGEVIWSQDSGASWQVLKGNFRSPVHGVYLNPKDTRLIYVALDRGLWRTYDKGVTWEELTNKFREIELVGGEIVVDLVFLPEYENGFLTATKYGLLLSENGGDDWQAYILLQQPNKIDIQSLAVNPENSDEIYYGTKNGLYKTVDGGNNWVTINPPSPRWVKSLVIDPSSTNTLYLGAWSPAE